MDDEPHAREGIRIRLRDYPGVQIAGECSSGTEAVGMIDKLKPDLVFLDVEMPGLNGFDVLRRVTMNPLPIVVFVTAYEKYAVKAFEFHALDYLLKPINEERFAQTLDRIVSELDRNNLEVYTRKLRSLQEDYFNGKVERENSSFNPATGSSQYLARLTVKTRDQISVIPVDIIDWMESAGDYVYVHTGGQKHIIRETLSSLEKRMSPDKFVRIHRSTIVNVEKIKSLRPNEHGDFDVSLTDGSKLKMSRSYRDHFRRVIGNSI